MMSLMQIICEKIYHNKIQSYQKMALAKEKKDYIRMIHVAQDLDLSQSPFSIDSVVKRVPNLLDRHLLVSLRVQSSTTHTKISVCIQMC